MPDDCSMPESSPSVSVVVKESSTTALKSGIVGGCVALLGLLVFASALCVLRRHRRLRSQALRPCRDAERGLLRSASACRSRLTASPYVIRPCVDLVKDTTSTGYSPSTLPSSLSVSSFPRPRSSPLSSNRTTLAHSPSSAARSHGEPERASSEFPPPYSLLQALPHSPRPLPPTPPTPPVPPKEARWKATRSVVDNLRSSRGSGSGTWRSRVDDAHSMGGSASSGATPEDERRGGVRSDSDGKKRAKQKPELSINIPPRSGHGRGGQELTTE
ncbi:hypothetical protein C8Q80DRAFT_1270062 [Daedaleopsis nitida]|nr:hypothetical protein C8Q80DRAFT_1270062 [Daedaleopsis nitida]